MTISNAYLNIGTLYSGLSNTSSNDNLTNFASIVSKYSYFKNNYADIKASLMDVDSDDNSEKSTIKTSSAYKSAISEANDVKSTANELKEITGKLVTDEDSIFKLDENENYDMDKMYDSINKFVSSYNELKEMASETSSDAVVEKAYYMVNTTKNYEKLLTKVGIDVNSDNTLSIDKDAFKKSDINTIKALFNGKYSYANLVNQKANQIANTSTSSYVSYTSNFNTNSVLETYLSGLTSTSIFDYLI